MPDRSTRIERETFGLIADSSVPTGTVTFLFTDIEGSTKLWEDHPDEMRMTLARHDALVRRAIVDANGYIFKTVGDAFCAAFAVAADAVLAVLAAQRAIIAEPWPEATPIKVRMALHTGAVENREGDYFGPVLNRVARLLVTGHGGQTLLSQTTYDLVRDTLPDAVTTRDLGAHQLKDLARPEQVYQLQHADLPGEFPPIKSLSTHPNNLPQQLTTFIGREKEIDAVRAMSARTRLVTLTGSGGSGKTRLALQVAAELLEQFPDGVWFVELASLTDPSLVPQTVANVLGVKEEPGQPIARTFREHMKQRRLLLLLDNCEHVIDACAKLVDMLVRHCIGVKVLATSREALGVAGEQAYRVPSLSLPDRNAAQTPRTLSVYESVQLFIDRALLVRADFAVTNQNAPALASVCCHLDGIPLAIELAAARVRTLSVEEIDGKLDQRFRLLTGGSRTALPRQQTLRSLIDWSYDLLREPEKQLLQRISVFAGGWTLAAAEEVCAGEGDTEVLDLLTSLADKSLVVAEQQDGHSRYRLLETVRQYARDRLAESGNGDLVRERHRDYFLALAEEAEPQLKSAEQTQWLRRLEVEHDNLRASLDWSFSTPGSAEGLRLCGALQRFWFTQGHLSEGREWCARLLGKAEAAVRTPERAKALNVAGTMASFLGDYLDARGRLAESLAIKRDLGDRWGMAASLHNLGVVELNQGDLASAKVLSEQSLAIMRELGDPSGIASSLTNLGAVAMEQGDVAHARTAYNESLAIQRKLGDRWGIALSLANLGGTAFEQGDLASAQALYEESVAIMRELGDRQNIGVSLGNLGILAREQRNFVSARALHEEHLAIARELGDRHGIADSLYNLGSLAFEEDNFSVARVLLRDGLAIQRAAGERRGIAASFEVLAEVVAALGDSLRAAGILGAAEQLREEIGYPLPPSVQTRHIRRVAAARTAVRDAAAFDQAWQEGRALTLEQAIELALADLVERQ